MHKKHINRVQRTRTSDGGLPPDSIYVGQPSKWGNPFRTAKAFEQWLVTGQIDTLKLAELMSQEELSERRAAILHDIGELSNRLLACWCPSDMHCHADVLCGLADGSILVPSHGQTGVTS